MYGEKQTIIPNDSNSKPVMQNSSATAPPPTFSERTPKKSIKTDLFDIFAIFAGFITVYFLISSLFNGYYFTLTGVYIAFLLFTTVYIVTKEKRFSLNAVFPLVLSVLTAVSFSINGYEFYSPAVPFLFYLSGLSCMALTKTKGYNFQSYVSIYQQISAILFIPIAKLFSPYINIFKNRKHLRNKKHLGVIVGILCGLPVFAVVTNLLVEGDAAFSEVMYGFTQKLESVLDKIFNSDGGGILWLILSLFFSPYIISTVFAFRHGITKEKLSGQSTEKTLENFRFISPSILGGFYGAVAACYVIYLLSQITYLFGAFSGEIPLGVSVSLSQYARRGFFEMSAVALINLCLIGAGVLLSKRENGQLSKLFKSFSVFFCLFTMLLIITAMSKMSLYITELGLTQKRILVSIADIILFITFLCILIKIFKSSFPYMKIPLYVALCIMCVYFVVSPDYVIAEFNTRAYLSGYHEKIDLETIYYLDNEYYALKNLDKLTQCDTQSIANAAKFNVYCIYNRNKNGTEHNSFDEMLAASYIRENEERFKTYEEYYTIDYTVDDNYVSHAPTVDTTFETGQIVLTVMTSKDIARIDFSNECGSVKVSNADSSPIFIYEEIYFDWAFSADSDTYATVTVTTLDGTEHTCEILHSHNSDTDPGDHITVVESEYFAEFELRDNSYGGFMLVETNNY